MLESKHYSAFLYSLDFHVLAPASGLLEKCLKGLVYLFSSEDTTDQTGGKQNEVIEYGSANIGSIIKMLFWIIMSIIMSLAIGQMG